jgi:hypothetical protein
VFWVSPAAITSADRGVSGGPGMAGMTALKRADGGVAGEGCRSSGRRVLGAVTNKLSIQSRVLKPTIGSKADRDRRCGRSFRTRLADRRGPRSNDGLWDGRLSASPPHAAFCDHHHNMVTIMRIVINNGLLASGSSGRSRGRPLGHPAADGGGGGNPCCAAARPVAAHLTYHLDTSAVAALVVTLLVRPSWYCA